MKKHILLSLLGIAVVVAGCTMTPKYTRPIAPVPAAWPGDSAGAAVGAATNASTPAGLRWQEFFTDQKLQQVIATALTNNRDLRLATLNVERARALYGIQRATLWPTIDANASLSRQRTPADVAGAASPRTSSQYDANLGAASWEIDLFGRIRSLKDEALQQYFATEQARHSAQILVVSSVAQAYLTLAADRESLRLAETTLESQQSAYDMIRRRHDLGLVTDLDLYRAQTPKDAARRDVAIYRQQVAQDENALDLLSGAPAARELLAARLDGVSPPRELAPGLSSEVLLLRPDILQAENLLKAANADIGAARAAFFPRISLTAAIGTASADLSGLFKAGQGAWSYAPQIVMPLFDARTWSAHRAAKVQREIAVTQYEKSIQTAFREVADTLAIRGNVDEALAAQQSLVDALAESYRLANSRYEKGIDSYLNVLDAQRSLFAAQQVQVGLHLAKCANQVKLYAVLGGGWQNEPAVGSNIVAKAPSPQPGK